MKFWWHWEFDEETKYDPRVLFCIKSKHDHLVRAWFHSYNLPILINCGNNYGPYQFPEKLIPLSINKALKANLFQYMAMGKIRLAFHRII